MSEQKRFHLLIFDQTGSIWVSSEGDSAPTETKGETSMTNRGDLVTKISTTVAGFVLGAYGLAFLLNTTNWL